MPYDAIRTRFGIWIEVAFLIHQVPGKEVPHILINIQLTDAPSLNHSIAKPFDAGKWCQRVLCSMNDTGGWRRRAGMVSRGVVCGTRSSLKQFAKPSIRCHVQCWRPQQQRIWLGQCAAVTIGRAADGCGSSNQVSPGRNPVTRFGSRLSSSVCWRAHRKAAQVSSKASIGVTSPFDSLYSIEIATMPQAAKRRAESKVHSALPALQPPPWNSRMAGVCLWSPFQPGRNT